MTPARRALLRSVTAAAMLVTLGARAQPADPSLEQPLRDLYAALESAMRAGRATPFSERFNNLAPVVDRVFDLETVLQVSVGLRWDSLALGAQTRLLNVFRRFTVATYVANFDKYDGEKFVVMPGTRDSGSDRIVGTEIVSGADRNRLDYVMRDANGTWRAVDVLLDGSISRVAVQRSDFRKLLANGNADALIASLSRKISDLSDGALSS